MGNFKDPSTPYPRGRTNRNNSRGVTQERGMRPLSRNRTTFKRGRRYEGRDNRPGSRCSRDNMGEWLRAARKPELETLIPSPGDKIWREMKTERPQLTGNRKTRNRKQ
jgi:hypothetical protein